MATVMQLLADVDRMYPNAETVEDKVRYMNMAQDELAKYFANVHEDSSLVTVAGQDSYNYPQGIDDISDIVSVAIAQSVNPTSRYAYVQYNQTYAYDVPNRGLSYYQVVDNSGNKSLVLNPLPTLDGLEIVIRYKKKLTALNANDLTFVPEFNHRYHHLLSFFACHMICSIGANPDAIQANMFMSKYESLRRELWKEHNTVIKEQKKVRKDNPQWHRGSGYARGN